MENSVPPPATTWERVMTMRRPEDERGGARRPVRRVAAVVSVVGYAVAMAVIELPAGPVVTAALAAIAIAVWLASVYVVHEFRRRLAHAPDAALDEREIRIRDRAYLQAHRLGAAAVFLAGLTVGPIVSAFGGSIDDASLIDVFLSLGMGLLMLPAAIVAWSERDDDPDLDDNPSSNAMSGVA